MIGPAKGVPLWISLSMLLVVIALPVLGTLVWRYYEERQEQIVSISDQAHELAKLAAAYQSAFFEGTRSVLEAASQLESVRSLDVPACSRRFAEIHEVMPRLLGLGATDSAGRAFCSSTGLVPESLGIGDRHYFQQAMRSKSFTVSGIVTGRRYGTENVILTQPVLSPAGEPIAAIVATYSIETISRGLSELQMPKNSVVYLLDSDGRAIATRLFSANRPGEPYKAPDDGIERAFAAVPLAAAPHLTVRVGLPVAPALSTAAAVFIRQVAIVLTVFIVATFAVFLLAERWIRRPIAYLCASAGALAGGDLASRVDPRRLRSAEAAFLAGSFNEMAAAVERNHEEMTSTAEVLQTTNNLNRALASELDLDRLVQKVVDSGLALTSAQLCAFFFNVEDADGGKYMLHAVAGAEKEKFAGFPLPRATAMFAETFHGAQVVRLDDVTKDPRFGRNAPYHGFPEGHPRFRSYMAVPVFSRSREAVGGLFFGHERAAMFDTRAQHLAEALADQASIAFENARAYRALDEEAARRREAEAGARELAVIVESSEDAIARMTLDGVVTIWNRGAERLLGFTAAEAIGAPISFVVPPERAEERREIVERLLRGEHIESFESERRHKSGKTVPVSVAMSLIRDEHGRPVAVAATARDITRRRHAEAAVADRAAKQRALAELGHDASATDNAQDVMRRAVHAVSETLGADFVAVFRGSDQGSYLRCLAAAGWPDGLDESETESPDSPAGLVLRHGSAVHVDDVRTDERFTPESLALRTGTVSSLNVPLGPSAAMGVLAVDFRGLRSLGPHDLHFVENVANILANAIARDEAREQEKLLLKELSHRVKNILALVLALAGQTRRSSGNVEEFNEKFSARIQSLSAAHDLLMERSWRGAFLRDLARKVLAPHLAVADERIVLKLDDVLLQPAFAQNLALMLHELATNAAKYGALSRGGARLVLESGIDEGYLTLRWTEHGVDIPTPPATEGFGTRLLRTALRYQHDGKADLEWRPDGLACTIRVRLSDALQPASGEAS